MSTELVSILCAAIFYSALLGSRYSASWPLGERLTFIVCWYDFWVGAYYAHLTFRLFIMLAPCVGFEIRTKQ